ncbi:MAG: hypothetical protein JRG91_18580 [Deltaproteobacteria bacterium]|nr:hypothetical protein [Deltaproteobacteria bacterium]
MHRATLITLLMLLPTLPLVSCGHMCTTEWCVFTVNVIDHEGHPVEDADVVSVIAGTGRGIGCSPDIHESYVGSGTYCIADDGTRGFDEDRTRVRVTVSRDGYATSIEDLFCTRGSCHVNCGSRVRTIVLYPAAVGHEAGG